MQDFLITNAKIMGISLTNSQADKLITYANLIYKWNKVYNLTAIKGLKNIIISHILDSLSILNFITNNNKVLDIGTGAGLPAVIIAIMSDNLVVAIDKVGKKTNFLRFIKAELNLDRLEIINDKVENLNEKFDIITSRAFSSIANTIKLGSNLLNNNGKFLLMKGPNYHLEKFDDAKIRAFRVQIPYLSEKRYILDITL